MREWKQDGLLMIRMIALDMDGTLLGSDGRVSARNLAAVLAAEAAGVRVVIATGRRHCYAMRQLRGLGLADDSVLVSSNGTVTRMLGAGSRLLDRTFLSTETSLWLCQHLAEFRDAMVITFDLVGADGEDAYGALVVENLTNLTSNVDRWVKANASYIKCVAPIERALFAQETGEAAPDPPIQMMVCGPVERMRLAEARLLEHPGVSAVGMTDLRPEATVSLSRTEYPERDLSIVDILPAGCSKGAALLKLAAGWGIKPEEMMAVGDNWNDVSMLEVAGRAVLMANAPEDLQVAAAGRGWLMGGHHDADGVGLAIEAALAGTKA